MNETEKTLSHRLTLRLDSEVIDKLDYIRSLMWRSGITETRPTYADAVSWLVNKKHESILRGDVP